MEARDPYVERRLVALEQRMAELEAEVASLKGEAVPVDQVASMDAAFRERLRAQRAGGR